MKNEVTVELVWIAPSARLEEARDLLYIALELAQLPAFWREWQRHDRLLPKYLKTDSALALFVNGYFVIDLADRSLTPKQISETLAGYSSKPMRFELNIPFWKRFNFEILPTLLVLLLPKCPFCIAAYLSILGIAGLNATYYNWFFFAATLILILITMTALLYRAYRVQRYLPVLAAAVGTAMILIDKLLLGSNWLIYIGVSVLIAAAIWNAFPNNRRLKYQS
ncbi:MAG TPA: MerC domain-containing protein [Pyrinomonadaceae bacterium]|jgi:hypothetical protein